MIPITTSIIIILVLFSGRFRRRVTSRRRSLRANYHRYVPNRIRYVPSVIRY